MKIYEIPGRIEDLFLEAPNSYRIIDYSPNMEMDNIQSMHYFIDCVGINDNFILEDYGTQLILQHPVFDYKVVIDSGGLGDFCSHGYEVTIFENE